MYGNAIPVNDNQMSVGLVLNLCHLCGQAIVLITANIRMASTIVLSQRQPSTQTFQPKQYDKRFTELPTHRTIQNEIDARVY